MRGIEREGRVQLTRERRGAGDFFRGGNCGRIVGHDCSEGRWVSG